MEIGAVFLFVSAPGPEQARGKYKYLLQDRLEEEGLLLLLVTRFVPGTVLGAGSRSAKNLFPGHVEHTFWWKRKTFDV